MIRRTTQVILWFLMALMLVLIFGCGDDKGPNPDNQFAIVCPNDTTIPINVSSHPDSINSRPTVVNSCSDPATITYSDETIPGGITRTWIATDTCGSIDTCLQSIGLGAPMPIVTTAAVSAITQTTAQSGGNVTSDGGAAVTARGVCWSTSPTPTIADSKTTDGTGTGSFTSSLTGLTADTPYYVRAYATNSAGTGYGSAQPFATESSSGTTVTDIDGNVYQTVTIGTQVWMMENLKVTHYRNGDPIPNVTDNHAWGGLSTGAYCEYDNVVNNVATYGRLYNWHAVGDLRGIAPEGWRVPTDEDWKQLEMYLGMSQAEADGTSWRGTDEGGKLKEAGTTHWLSPNAGATNESGFTALPGGGRGISGTFSDVGVSAAFWSSAESGSNSAWYRGLGYSSSQVYRHGHGKQCGFSVRCVRD